MVRVTSRDATPGRVTAPAHRQLTPCALKVALTPSSSPCALPLTMSTTTSNTAGEYDEKSQTVAPDNATTYLDDQIVMIDGKEIVKKIDSQPRIPQVTFRIQPKTNRNPAPIHYAKMFLPKTHEVYYDTCSLFRQGIVINPWCRTLSRPLMIVLGHSWKMLSL